MNNLINFDYQERPVRVITDENGAPWWVARDVCEVLGYTKYRDVLSKQVDEDERMSISVDTPGGIQEMIAVNESGLYTLIIRSNKKEAKPFRKWVTGEVLPSLRKTGQYIMPGCDVPYTSGEAVISVQRLSEVAQGVKAAMIMARAFGFKDHEARRMANRLVKKMTGIDAMELLEIPEPVYIEEEVIYRDFLAECCDIVEGARVNATELYEAFKEWCDENDIASEVTQKTFGMNIGQITARGKENGRSYYKGIRLKG